MRKKFLFISVSVLTIMAAGCGKLDVVGTDSARAFQKMLDTLPPVDTSTETGKSWTLKAPDSQANFVIQWDTLYINADAAPFINAGLDTGKLPGGMLQGDNLVIKLDLDSTAPAENAAPMEVYNQVLLNHRNIIGYHGALDHYGISFGGGNMFEWAKDMSVNDKDIVFVLNPAPFLAAGVDPNKIDGWVFAKVPVDDENGKPVEVDKLLKPFDLK
ncbi:hypothetical protein AGMMS50212_12680 [Spirochaetia bacterium]|nr:hypothetical protein AGMMS50212_12680 [Spirochaetia bacterium]